MIHRSQMFDENVNTGVWIHQYTSHFDLSIANQNIHSSIGIGPLSQIYSIKGYRSSNLHGKFTKRKEGSSQAGSQIKCIRIQTIRILNALHLFSISFKT